MRKQGNRTYTVKYVPYRGYNGEKQIQVLARYRTEAYVKAIYEEIPKVENGEHPYYAYVYSVTFQNGNYKIFDMGKDN